MIRLHCAYRARFLAIALVTALFAALPAVGVAGATTPVAKNSEAVLKVGADFNTPTYTPTFDLTKSKGYGNSTFDAYVYGSLLQPLVDGGFKPALAKSAEIVDPSTIVVKLRPNLKFQDGTALDAESVKFTILRNVAAAGSTAILRPALKLIASIDVTSPTDLTIRLSKPAAGSFYPVLAFEETAPVSPTAVKAGKDLNVEPVGAGPFRLVSRDNQRIVFEKWNGYYAASQVKLDRIELINTSTESIIVAYRTGAIDFATLQQPDLFDQLGGAPVKVKTFTDTASPLYFFIQMNCGAFPEIFGDVRVRQALMHATNRNALNRLVNPGGEVMTQFAAKGSPFYTPSLAKTYSYDVDKAKRLLAQAGKSDLRFTMYNAAHRPYALRVAEVLQEQWAKAGITLELVGSANSTQDFYITPKIHSLMQPAIARTNLDYLTNFFEDGFLGSVCLPNEARGLQGNLASFLATSATSDEGVDLYKAMQRTIVDQALVLPIYLAPTLQAWNSRFHKFTIRPAGALYIPDFLGTRLGA